jgi:DNA helicase-2/ATP-dependent DNA helicase PcrA
MTFEPSKYQQAGFDWVRDGRGSAVLVAVAGSGKTTWSVRSLLYTPPGASITMLAFNTSAAATLRDKIAELEAEVALEAEATGKAARRFSNVSAKTFHALGFGALRKFLAGRGYPDVKPDGKKLTNLCRDWLGDDDNDLYGSFICRLVGLARGEGIGVLTPDLPAAWWNLIQFHDLFLDSEGASEEHAIELARELLRRSDTAAKAGNIDFDDMLYCPLRWKLRLWQNDIVYCDEAQDTNPVRRALLRLALKPGGRLIAVGDPCQSIYLFTGASHDAIEQIKHDFNARELPLTISYRCCRTVGALARTLVPYFEVFEGAPEGLVEHLPLSEAYKLLGPRDAILCRNTAPLIITAYQLIARGVGCTVLGREIGAGLVALIKQQRAKGVDNLLLKLAAYRDREVAKWTAKGDDHKAEAVSDKVECIGIVIAQQPETARTVPAIINRIESMFSDETGVLTLCTAHKAKGREWERVAILRPELMPSKWARTEQAQVQERNLQYVAWTRAMKHLIFLDTAEKEETPK